MPLNMALSLWNSGIFSHTQGHTLFDPWDTILFLVPSKYKHFKLIFYDRALNFWGHSLWYRLLCLVITWFFNSYTVFIFLISWSDFHHSFISPSPCSVMLRHLLSNYRYLSMLWTYSGYLCMSSLCHHLRFCGKTIVLLSFPPF